jgi:hypothetical protein
MSVILIFLVLSMFDESVLISIVELSLILSLLGALSFVSIMSSYEEESLSDMIWNFGGTRVFVSLEVLIGMFCFGARDVFGVHVECDVDCVEVEEDDDDDDNG